MSFSLKLPTETAHFGPAQGQMSLNVWKDGVLSRFGHDLTLGFQGYSLSAEAQPDDKSVRFELTIPKSSFFVKEPSTMMESLKREVCQNIQKHLPGDILVEGTLFPITRSEIKVQATATMAGRLTPLSFHCRLQANRLQGETRLTHRQFHLKPYKAPLGVLKIKDEMDFSFSFSWPEAASSS